MLNYLSNKHELTLCSEYGSDLYEKDNSHVDRSKTVPYPFKMPNNKIRPSSFSIALAATLLALMCQTPRVLAANANNTNTTGDNATNSQLLEDFLPGNSPGANHTSQASSSRHKSKPRANSPDSVNFNYSLDNEHDTDAHLGGDVYFGSNTHFGIYGESSTESATSTGTGSSMTTKTYGVTLGTNWRKPFSVAVSLTSYGINGDLTENTVKVPLNYNLNRNWSFTLKPGAGAIRFDVYNPLTRKTTNPVIIDQSIGGAINYTLGNWQFYLYAEVHAFSRNPKGIGSGNLRLHIKPSTTLKNLASEIVRNAQTASAMYYFNRFDLGVEFDRSQSALDNSISNTWTLNNDIYCTRRLTISPSFAATTTPGTNVSTGQPYPDTYTGTVGMTYTFD